MADGRMIKKEIRRSKKMGALKNDKARTLYFMIYPHVDVEGRFVADPADIKIECVPQFGWTEKTIEKALCDLHNVGLIKLYNINENRYLQISRFHDHQRIDKNKEAKSKIPPPEYSRVLQSTPEDSAISKVKISKDKLNICIHSKDINNRDIGVDIGKVGKDSSPYLMLEKKILSSWNLVCDKIPTLSRIIRISEGRRLHLKRRFENKHFVENINTAISLIPRSSFLKGNNKRGWRISFDWLIKNDENYLKVLEGKYKDDAEGIDKWRK